MTAPASNIVELHKVTEIVTIEIVHADAERMAFCQRLLAADPGLRIVAAAGTGAGGGIEAAAIAGRARPAVLVLDYAVEKERTPTLIDLLLLAAPLCRVLLLTDRVEEDAIIACLLAGARGTLDIADADRQMAKAIHCIHTGEAWISRAMVVKLLAQCRIRAGTPPPEFVPQHLLAQPHRDPQARDPQDRDPGSGRSDPEPT